MFSSGRASCYVGERGGPPPLSPVLCIKAKSQRSKLQVAVISVHEKMGTVTFECGSDNANFATDIYSRMDNLTEVNYKKWLRWKFDMESVLLFNGLRIAYKEDAPSKPADTALPEEIAKYEKWEASNILCLALMESKMCRSIFNSLAISNKSSNAKQMLAALEEMVMKDERIKAPKMLKKLLNMRYDGQGNVRIHLSNMAFLAKRLRNVDIGLPDYLINQLALDSLPSRFDPIRIAYNVQKEKWGFHEIMSQCGGAEDLFRLTDELNKRRMTGNANDNSKYQQGHRAKKTRNIQCFSCGQKGHFARNCRQASSK